MSLIPSGDFHPAARRPRAAHWLAFVEQLDLTRQELLIQRDIMPEPRAAKALLQLYRRFLALKLADPELPFAAPRLVDEVWHLHIIDMAKYAEDCRSLCGTLILHDPLPDMDRHEAAWARTVDGYRREFGIDLLSQTLEGLREPAASV